jgi:hypothetical protein
MKLSHYFTVEETLPDLDDEGAQYVKPSDHKCFVDADGNPRRFISPMEIHQVVIDASNANKKFEPPVAFRIVENFEYIKD